MSDLTKDNDAKKSEAINRRAFLQVTAAVAGSAVLAACGGGTPAPQAKTVSLGTTIPPAQATATIQAAIGKTYFPSGDPNIPDAFTGPLPAYQSVTNVPGTGKPVTAFSMLYTTLPLAYGQNKFWQQLNKTLNVNWQPIFSTSDGYAEKASVLVASNNPPDLFLIWPENVPALYSAVTQGAFLDLTAELSGSALQKYPNLARISPKVWKNSGIGGKLYGVPRSRSLVGNALFVRADWLKKVGITAPKNADEFYTLMTEISKGKLNNGQQTWGLGGVGHAGYGQAGANGDVSPWIFAMFGVPSEYRLESNGSLTHYTNTQEFVDAMAYLRKLYQAGVFYPDALVMTTSKAKINFAAGKFAGYWDGILAIGSASGLQVQTQAADPNADVNMLVPPGAQGGNPGFWLGSGNFARAAIPASVTDDNRVQELLRLLDYLAAPVFSLESNFLLYGIDGWDNATQANGVKKLNATGQKEGVTGLPYIMNGPAYFYVPESPSVAIKEQKYATAAYAIGVSNPTLGLFSPTAVKQATILNQVYKDRFLHIVTGTEPVSAAKDMYNDWLKNGGTQILQELTDALHKSS